MFLSYYKLQKNPFKISSDPSFLWMGEKHKEALATLTYGIDDNKGFLLLTGDVGSGKTTIINALLNNIGENVVVGVISDPGLSPIDFFNYIAYIFDFKKKFESKGDFLIHFSMFLNGIYIAKKKVLLIIDEAQRMPDELLEEVRLLSNIERQDTKLINIFFVGQSEFNKMLLKESNRALKQRLALNYHIPALNEAETLQYIKHRLQVAGGKYMMFTAEAVSEIYKYSGGYPRQINIICDHAMLSGYVKEKQIINDEIIKECVKELNISHKTVKKNSQNSEKDFTPEIESNLNETETTSPKDQNSNNKPTSLKSKKSLYIIAVIATAIVILLSYIFISKSIQPNQIVEIAEKKLTSLYSTVFEKSATDYKSSVEGEIVETPPNTTSTIPKENINKIEEQPKEEQPTIEESSSSTAKEISDINLIINTPKTPQETAAEQPKSTSDEEIKEEKGDELTESIKSDRAKTDQTSPTEPIKSDTTEIDQTSPTESIKSEIVETDPTYLNKKVTINFDYNSNDLSSENRQELQKLVQLLKEDKNRKIKIIGHSDSMGNPSYNMQLSIFRANIVKSFMSGSGAEPEQLIVEGKGGGEPVADNRTAQGREINRRVELEFILP